MNNGKNWGIIGGGIMGMTLALRLVKQGYKVTIFEAGDKPGGLTSSWEFDGITWDRFYHVVLLSDHNTRGIIEEIGLGKEFRWVETKTGFYSGGKLYSMSNLIEFFKFPPISLFDKFRLGLTIWVASKIKDWKKLEKILVTDWLLKWSGQNVFITIWLPLLRAKLGENYRHTSAAFIWSTIQRMYAARKSGLKKEMFGYIAGGYNRINRTFALYLVGLGVTFEINSEVRAVQGTADGKVQLEVNTYALFLFDHVISTLSPQQSVNIAGSLTEDEKQQHGNIRFLGVICPVVILKKPISQFYVTNITDRGMPFTGIIEMSALVDKEIEFKGKNLVYLPRYVHIDDPLFDASDADLRTLFLDALMILYPEISQDDVLFFGVSRARAVFALPVLNYSALLPGVRTSIRNFHIVNSAQIVHGTLNVNETIGIADSKLQIILDEIKTEQS
jgi:protoporphyrinogen oxidase